MKKNLYALTLVAGDRPGIVASVSKVFYENNFNIEDSSSTLLKGFFAAIFIVSHEDELSVDEVRAKFSELNGIDFYIKKIVSEPGFVEGDHFIVSVYGADKAGIVHKVSSYLADEKINIIDLQTKVAGKENNPIYIMVLEVVPPKGSDDAWVEQLKKISQEMGTDVNVRQIETYEF